MTETPEAPSRESQLRAARLRALLAIIVAFVICAGAYFFCSSPFGLPGVCKSSSDCDGLGSECLHAPTGAYCTHSCNRNEDCRPGTHCDIPPWEKEQTTTAFCIHDTANVGKN